MVISSLDLRLGFISNYNENNIRIYAFIHRKLYFFIKKPIDFIYSINLIQNVDDDPKNETQISNPD